MCPVGARPRTARVNDSPWPPPATGDLLLARGVGWKNTLPVFRREIRHSPRYFFPRPPLPRERKRSRGRGGRELRSLPCKDGRPGQPFSLRRFLVEDCFFPWHKHRNIVPLLREDRAIMFMDIHGEGEEWNAPASRDGRSLSRQPEGGNTFSGFMVNSGFPSGRPLKGPLRWPRLGRRRGNQRFRPKECGEDGCNVWLCRAAGRILHSPAPARQEIQERR